MLDDLRLYFIGSWCSSEWISNAGLKAPGQAAMSHIWTGTCLSGISLGPCFDKRVS